MPGCGVNPSNILQIAEETGASEFHFSGRSTYESGMIYRNPNVSMGGTVKIEEYEKDVTNPDIVKAALAELAMEELDYATALTYIEQGLGFRRLAIIFSVVLILTYGVGFNMLASYNLQSTFYQIFCPI